LEGSKNTYRAVDPIADRIAELRLESAAKKAAGSSQKAFTPQSLIPVPETLGLHDSVPAPQNTHVFPTETLKVIDSVPAPAGATSFAFFNSGGTGGVGDKRWNFNSFTNSSGGFT